jgi:hypothetical protein
MMDLFGDKHEEPDEYQVHLASRKWAQLRTQKLAQVGYCCERCGLSRHTRPLDVHHLTYDRLGHERLEDLQVLCKTCHEGADEERARAAELKRAQSALYKGFEKWLKRKAGLPRKTISAVFALREKKEFLRFLKAQSGVCYSLDLNVIDIRDPNPEWKP